MTIKPFREIRGSDLSPARLKQEMEAHGYALIRSLLLKEHLGPLLQEITGILRQSGWLDASASYGERLANITAASADGDQAYKPVRDRIFALEALHALPHHPVLRRTMTMLVGERLLIHPKPEIRLIFPDFERGVVHAHQDHTSVEGDEESFTAWIPLHDCPLDQGPLQVADGSHRLGQRETIGQTGYISDRDEKELDWVSGEINAGDVLFFHSLTVHRASPNHSRQLRISLDCRFQSYDRVVNPAVLVFTGSGKRSWESTYANWSSDELKYYWTKLPLCLKPSKAELTKLAQTAESPELRERYARILERLESQSSVPQPAVQRRPQQVPAKRGSRT